MTKATNTASRQKANTNAPVQPTTSVKTAGTNAKTTAAATNPVKATAPTTTKTVIVKATTNAKAFALSDVTITSVQRARQLRQDDPERYSKFRNFFAASDAETTLQISNKDVTPKVLTRIQECQENQEGVLALIAVSAALTKYGEQELLRRYTLGEMDYLVGSRFGTNGLRSKLQVNHTVSASFVLRLVSGLAPEKRAACQCLRDIVSLDNNLRLVLTLTNKGLKPAAIAGKTDKVGRDRLLRITKQAQSARFQEAMLQVGGQYIYDAIRTLVKQFDASVWDGAKDKPALKNIRARAGSASTNKVVPRTKQQSIKQQPTEKVGTPGQQPKKHLPVEVKSWVQVPPPAPTTVKNATPVKNTSSVKNAAPVKDTSASVVQSRPAAVVNNGSAISSRAATAAGGRTTG